LPAHLVLDTQLIARGANLVGGEKVISQVASEPTFSLAITPEQSSLIPRGTQVELTAPDAKDWSAVSGPQTAASDGNLSVTLGASGGKTICGSDCGLLSVRTKTSLSANVIITPKTTGLTIPTSALISRASGRVGVVGKDGKVHSVTVVQSALGMSVIRGVPVGFLARIPAESQQ